MMKKNIKIIVLLGFICISTAMFLVPHANVKAQVTAAEQARCDNFKKQFNAFDTEKTTLTSEIPTDYCSSSNLLYKAMIIMFSFAGGIAVLFIVVGAYFMLASGGNEEQIEKGKKTLTNAIIGLVVVLLAVTIIRIVTNAVTTGSTTSSGTNGNTSSQSNVSPGGTNAQNASGEKQTPSQNDPATSAGRLVKDNVLSPVVHGKDMVFKGTVSSANAAALAKACGVSSITEVSLSVTINSGDIRESRNFTVAQGSYSASMTIPSDSLKNDSTFDFALYVCQNYTDANFVNGGKINVVNDFSTVPSGSN